MGWGFRTPPGLHHLYTSTAGWGCLDLLSPMDRARATPQAVSATCRGGEVDLMVGNVSADLNSHGKHGSGRRFLSGGVNHGDRQPEIVGGRLRRQNDRRDNQCHRPRAGSIYSRRAGGLDFFKENCRYNEGEPLSPDAPCARRTLPRGSESSHITPAHPALICPSCPRR